MLPVLFYTNPDCAFEDDQCKKPPAKTFNINW